MAQEGASNSPLPLSPLAVDARELIKEAGRRKETERREKERLELVGGAQGEHRLPQATAPRNVPPPGCAPPTPCAPQATLRKRLGMARTSRLWHRARSLEWSLRRRSASTPSGCARRARSDRECRHTAFPPMARTICSKWRSTGIGRLSLRTRRPRPRTRHHRHQSRKPFHRRLPRSRKRGPWQGRMSHRCPHSLHCRQRTRQGRLRRRIVKSGGRSCASYMAREEIHQKREAAHTCGGKSAQSNLETLSARDQRVPRAYAAPSSGNLNPNP